MYKHKGKYTGMNTDTPSFKYTQVQMLFFTYHQSKPLRLEVWYCLVWFSGISTIVGFSMPNPVYKYYKNYM